MHQFPKFTPLPIIRSLFTVRLALVYMSYRFEDSLQAGQKKNKLINLYYYYCTES